MAAWKNQGSFQSLIEQDPFIAKHLSTKEIATCFNPQAYVRHQKQIFRRVFGKVEKPIRDRASQKRRSSQSSRKG
jgi:adenylosuccinate lyase